LGESPNAGYAYLEVRCLGCGVERTARFMSPTFVAWLAIPKADILERRGPA